MPTISDKRNDKCSNFINAISTADPYDPKPQSLSKNLLKRMPPTMSRPPHYRYPHSSFLSGEEGPTSQGELKASPSFNFSMGTMLEERDN